MSILKAVITGDLVGSTAKGAAAIDAAMAVLARTAADLRQLTGHDTRFTRHRGDGWQIYLEAPGWAVTCALVITTGLRQAGLGFDTRQAIGVGSVEILPPADLGRAFGKAFEVSGLALDQMARGDRLCLVPPSIVTPLHAALVSLIAWQCGRWSTEQAQAVHCVLLAPSRPKAELAARLGISRQAFEARLATAGFPALEPALGAFQTTDWQALAHG